MSNVAEPLSVSVILPLHNGAKHVTDAVASVLGQTRAPLEVIVVDDGSTDGGADLLSGRGSESDAGPVIRVVTQGNAGQSAARNHGAQLATGELLAFIDQDDLWHPRHLEVLVEPFATDDRLGWAFSDFDEIDADGYVLTRSFLADAGVATRRRSLGALLAGDLMVLPSASVLRASAFAEVGGFDPDLQGYEDDDLYIRFFRHGWSAAFVAESVTSFRTHGTSSSAGDRFQRSRVRFLEKLRATVPDDPRMNRFFVPDLVVPRLFATTLTEYCVALRVGDHDGARRLATTARQISERSGTPTLRRRVELWLLDRPTVMTRFLRTYEAIPRRLRPPIHPALSLRSPGARSH